MILITGANGQLGQSFQKMAAQYPNLQFIFAGSTDLDIADGKAVQRFFGQHNLRGCINCAAYTAVDKAESEPEQAWRSNVSGVQHLARACAAQHIPLIHFSTDYVYHSRQNRPFVETDAVSPKGVYARTKLQGERAALRLHPTGAMIIRTSWVYSEFGHNFLKTMLRLGAERPALSVVFDQIGTPTYAPDLAEAVLFIIDRVQHGVLSGSQLPGIWHYSNEGVASWYDFAQAIFDIQGLPCRVSPIESAQYPTPAQRPPFSVMNKNKIKDRLGVSIPHWRESLTKCLEEMRK